MCDSKNFPHSMSLPAFAGRTTARITGWAGALASVGILLASSGCCLGEARRCHNCRCHARCASIYNVSDQYLKFRYSVPVPGTVTSAILAPVDAGNQYYEATAPTPQPVPAPVVSEKTPPAPKQDPPAENRWSSLEPKQIDAMVEQIFEQTGTAAGKEAGTALSDDISASDPPFDILRELENRTDSAAPETVELEASAPETSATGDLESGEVHDELNAQDSSMIDGAPEAVVAQLPAESVARPFGFLALPPVDQEHSIGRNSRQGRTASGRDHAAFELDPIPRLRAIPVDKKNQRMAGIPLSSEETLPPRSNLSFLTDSTSSLFVLPNRSDNSWTPLKHLESMGTPGAGELKILDKDSGESQSALPRANEVRR
jgi:hypothetical protein